MTSSHTAYLGDMAAAICGVAIMGACCFLFYLALACRKILETEEYTVRNYLV